MKLTRIHFHEKYTEGTLESAYIHLPIYTLELPWIPSQEALGGKNDISCIPNGEYTLSEHHRQNGDRVLLLMNHALGVYKFQEHRVSGGRFLIEVHVANYLKELLGCIAPGRTRTAGRVWRSNAAMERILHAFDAGDRTLRIQSADTKEIYYPHSNVNISS